MVAILDRDPLPLAGLETTHAAALQPIVGRALAKERADRYSRVGEFRAALKDGFDESAQSSPAGRPKLGPPRLRWSRAMAALTLVLAGGAAFGVWRLRSRSEPSGSPVVRLAVLPFENLGADSEGYLTNGMTVATRNKLNELPPIQLAARGSSNQYAGSSKSPQQIGSELGVDYLLTAKVRWQKTGDQTGHVQVTSVLIQVSTGSTRWQQVFDVPLEDVFRAQSNIALQVAEALHVPLTDSLRQLLTEWPTHSLAAYDASLRANQAETTQEELTWLERAVSLDSSFVEAWAEISMVHSDRYFNGTPTTAESQQARQAAERAMALAPDRADGYHALGWYHWAVTKDYERAADEYTQGLRLAPNDVTLLTDGALAASALGLWEIAVARLQRAADLNRRSAHTRQFLASVLLNMRRYADAQRVADSALALAPTYINAIRVSVMIAVAQGDLSRARAVMATLPADAPPSDVAQLAGHNELYWVLSDSLQRALLRFSPDPFDGDRATWGIVLAETNWFRGTRGKARAYADSARIALEQQLGAAPEDPQLHVFRGIMLAYLGRKLEAMQEGERAAALLPIGKSAEQGAYIQHQLARIYILVGEPEKALNQLEPLLRIPYYLSSGWLKLDPEFIPLRNNPRFRKLIGVA
jgi:TolB-like protein/Flp pilus assembly protein TadD